MSTKHSYAAIIIGSGGGIGLSLKQELSSRKDYYQLFCYSKSHDIILDITDEKQILKAVQELKQQDIKINLLINTIGYLHDKDFSPEKKISEINNNYLINSFKINAIGHALVIKHFAPLMDHKNISVLACLSARVGSISDNYLGGWFGYRASKAALNQIVRSASVEFGRKKSNLIFIAIHPGTVLTKLSKPFIKKKNYFTANQSANHILKVISNLKIEDSGNFVDYQGIKIPY